jgi:hypothetical protein
MKTCIKATWLLLVTATVVTLVPVVVIEDAIYGSRRSRRLFNRLVNYGNKLRDSIPDESLSG